MELCVNCIYWTDFPIQYYIRGQALHAHCNKKKNECPQKYTREQFIDKNYK